MNNNKTYLGDGAYVEHDGYQFLLTTERAGRTERIALEPEVLQAFFRYVECICDVKITAVKNPPHDAATSRL
jgi:hypothetical protein